MDIDYSNESVKNNFKITKSDVTGNRKLHTGLTENSESSLISLSFSDSLTKKSKKIKNKDPKEKTSKLANLLGAKNLQPPQNSFSNNFVPKNSAPINQFNSLNNDGYNVYSPASIPDVNQNLEKTMDQINRNENYQEMNNLNLPPYVQQQGINNFNSNLPPYVQQQGINNFNSNLPPYVQQELNNLQLNKNIKMSETQGLPMNFDQGLPMNNVPMNNLQMNNLPVNNLQMNNLPMNNIPMNYIQNGMQDNFLNQNQIDSVLKKYGPNYNGPIDMIGGSNVQELNYYLDSHNKSNSDSKNKLNDNLSSGQKKKTKLIKNEGGKQTGGFERIIPKYVGTKNTPFKSQETKKIETTRFNEIPNYLKDNSKEDPLLEFKLNPSLLGVQKPINQSIVPAQYIPIQNKVMPSNFPYVSGAHNMLPYSFVPNNVPVIKNYHISMPNPAGDHIKLADLYEDMLPQNENNYKNTSLTLEERLITYNYVRSILVRIGDGEDIELSGKIGTSTNRKNLLSYLKLLDLNPYHNSKISQNPYSSLPEKMLMYRSCYPIRFDASKNKVTCSKYSIGLNLRIYEMSIAEFEVKKMFYSGKDNNNDIKKSRFNLWREIAYYEFVREEILKKKICPHFCMIYSWFISTGSDVDFKKLRIIKNQFGKEISKADLNTSLKITNDYKDALKKNYKKQEIKQLNTLNDPIPVLRNGPAPHLGNHLHQFSHNHKDLHGVSRHMKSELNKIHDKNINVFHDSKDRFQTELNSSVNRCLLALTEAPNYNITQWATKTYEHEMIGPVKKMIQTGYHHANVWISIIFQIMITLQVMFLKKFTFYNMNIEDNIYIKDLMNNEQVIGFWKYIFKGYEFYIPNHGYLVMIDSNYKDIKNDHKTYASVKNSMTKDNEQFKMYGEAVDEDFDYSNDNDKKTLDEIQYENLCNILNPDNFGKKYTNYGGIRPDSKVIKLLSEINNVIKNRSEKNGDLSDVIINYMGMYLNNRTGTQLTTTELEKVILEMPVNNLTTGQMYAYNLRDQIYVWVVFAGVSDENTCDVLMKKNFKNTDEILIQKINRNNLFEYSSLSAPEQKYKPQEVKLSEDELLEIYYVN